MLRHASDRDCWRNSCGFADMRFIDASAGQAVEQIRRGNRRLLVSRVAHERNPDAAGNASMVAYETLWIVRDSSGAHVAAKLPDIIVPRKSGFWRLGIAHTCQLAPPVSSEASDHGNIRTDDIAYATPVTRSSGRRCESRVRL